MQNEVSGEKEGKWEQERNKKGKGEYKRPGLRRNGDWIRNVVIKCLSS